LEIKVFCFDYFYLVHHQAIARAIDGGISAVLAVHTRVWRTLVEARFLPWLARAVLDCETVIDLTNDQSDDESLDKRRKFVDESLEKGEESGDESVGKNLVTMMEKN